MEGIKTMKKYKINNKAIYAGGFEIGIDKPLKNETAQVRKLLQLKELENLKQWCEAAILELSK